MINTVKVFRSQEQDRNVLRFLWIDDFPKPYEDINISLMCMTRVSFGASPSPFLLAVTIRYHLRKYQQQYPTVTSALGLCLYVVDLICSAPSVQLRAYPWKPILSFKMQEWIYANGVQTLES